METISFEDFQKIEIRIGKIISAEKVEGSDKLLKLEVDFGPIRLQPEATNEVNGCPTPVETDLLGLGKEMRTKRQIIAGLAQFYAPEALIGKECPFAFNLAPRTLKGLESQGMILCPLDESSPVLLHPDKEVKPGSIVK